MNLDQAKLQEYYMVELHPKGGSQIRQVREVMKERQELFMAGQVPEWMDVAVCDSYAEARKELARVRKAMRDSAEAIREVKKPDPEEHAGKGQQGEHQSVDPLLPIHGREEDQRSLQATDAEDRPADQAQQGKEKFNQDHGGSVA